MNLATESLSGPKRTILVVDDSATIRKLISQTLKGDNYDLVVAGSGAEALGLISNHRIDLALLDYQMGDMTASDFCAQLQEVVPEGIPSLLVTAYHAAAQTALTKHTCLIGYLTKPFHPQEVRTALERVFARLEEMQVEPKRSFAPEEELFTQEPAEIVDIEDLVPGGVIFEEIPRFEPIIPVDGEDDGISLRHGCFIKDGKAEFLRVYINGSLFDRFELNTIFGFIRTEDDGITLTFPGKVVRLVTTNRNVLATKLERGEVEWISGSTHEISVITVA